MVDPRVLERLETPVAKGVRSTDLDLVAVRLRCRLGNCCVPGGLNATYYYVLWHQDQYKVNVRYVRLLDMLYQL